ncbi:ankyrin repeat-containing domain protein [Plectosphaerella plurivora]|uniref:Ankyrin repeat-containing domain protein n=1 Tax=Plectosphaerella plurivora TaxID=936078 RepID=A0A9P8V8D4_9PEZI|nr:ankyrin repeat-containing domain protein [Plectosphaerella plurivora]
MLEKGADINAQGGLLGNALQAAVARGHKDIVMTLLEKGADINAQGGLYGNALNAAVVKGDEDIVITLLEKGANVNTQDGLLGDALQAAAAKEDAAILGILFQKGANLQYPWTHVSLPLRYLRLGIFFLLTCCVAMWAQALGHYPPSFVQKLSKSVETGPRFRI